MSAEDRDDNDPLQSLIAEILEAENRGETVDREKLVDQHPEHADSLKEFFASHDRMKSAAEVDPPTLPPAGDDSPLDDPTLLPSTGARESATLPPTEPALGSAQDAPVVGDKVRYFGDYELLDEIARGGMGVVYKARQANLNRVVALKMILAGQFAGEEDVQRFYTEAEAAASLDHPGIVPIFEIGEHAGQHYFSMGYIEGESLAQRVAEGPLPPREAAELVKKICDAMAYAHDRGVIHRDLKPANILIDSNGQPKVTDFGLAKKTEADSGLTGTGQILGTPAYMPPEQASGKTDVGPLADVYSLGAILYCLLTGRPPFQASSPMDTLLQVLDQEPVAPRTLNPQVPQDLETISLKCLSKESKKRYVSASDLSGEFKRFLNGEPIHARPVGNMERSWRWCRRNPAVAALAALAAAFLILGSVGITYFGIDARTKAEIAAKNESLAIANAEEAHREKKRADIKADEALAEEERANANAAEALAEKSRADDERALAETRLYASQITSAQREWDLNECAAAWDYLNASQKSLRGWEHAFLESKFSRGQYPFTDHPSRCVAISADGSLLVSASSRTCILWDLSSGRKVRTFPRHPRSIDSISVSPDGMHVAATGSKIRLTSSDQGPPPSGNRGEIKIWNIATGEEVHSIAADDGGVYCMAFSPDGKTLAGGSDSIRIWDLDSSEEITTLKADMGTVKSLCFHPDGLKIASGSTDGIVRIWDIDAGNVKTRLNGHGGAVNSITYVGEGHQIISGSADHTIKRWNAEMQEVLTTFRGHTGPVTSVTVGANGTKIISASADKTIKIWNAETGLELQELKGHSAEVHSVATNDTVSLIASASSNSFSDIGSVRVWRPEDVINPRSIARDIVPITGFAISPDGKQLVSGSSDGTVTLWDAASMQQLMVLEGNDQAFVPMDFSHNGHLIAMRGVSKDNNIKICLWENSSKKLMWTTSFPIQQVMPLDRIIISPDGTKVASICDGAKRLATHLLILDAATGDELVRSEVGVPAMSSMAFSPAGDWIVTSCMMEHRLRIWDANTARLIRTLTGHTGPILDVDISRDGSTILSASGDRTIKIWNAQTGKEQLTLVGHSNTVWDVSFDGSNTRIASASLDGTIRIWDAAMGVELLKLRAEERIWRWGSVTFAGDDRWLFASGAVVRPAVSKFSIWDAKKPLPPTELYPEHVDAHLNLGKTLHQEGNLAAAVNAWRKAIELDPQNAKMHNHLAWTLVATSGKSGNYPHAGEAVQWMRRVVEIAPKEGAFWNTLGVAYYRAEDWKEALCALQHSIKLGYDNPFSWLFIAMSQWHLDNKEEARTWYEKSLVWRKKLQPNSELQSFYAEAEAVLSPNAAKIVTRLQRAHSLTRDGKSDEARVEYRIALQLLDEVVGDNLMQRITLAGLPRFSKTSVYLSLVGVERESGNHDAEQSVWKELNARLEANPVPNLPSYWGYLGQSCYEIDRLPDARRAFEKVLAMRHETEPTVDGGPRWWYLTMILARLGETETAKGYYKTLVAQLGEEANESQVRFQVESAKLLGLSAEIAQPNP